MARAVFRHALKETSSASERPSARRRASRAAASAKVSEAERCPISPALGPLREEKESFGHVLLDRARVNGVMHPPNAVIVPEVVVRIGWISP